MERSRKLTSSENEVLNRRTVIERISGCQTLSPCNSFELHVAAAGSGCGWGHGWHTHLFASWPFSDNRKEPKRLVAA